MIIRTPIEYCHPAFSNRLNTLAFQNPESARSSLTPLAPARSTRAISSSQNRSIPSACCAPNDVAAAYRYGANSYVRKPVDFDQFAEVIHHLGVYWLVVNEPPPDVRDL